jgi:hypothetical protein
MSRLFIGANHVSCVCLFICLIFFFFLSFFFFWSCCSPVDSLNNEATGKKYRLVKVDSWNKKLREKKRDIQVIRPPDPIPSFLFVVLPDKINIQLNFDTWVSQRASLACHLQVIRIGHNNWLIIELFFSFFFRPCLVSGKIVSHFFFLFFPHWRDV